MHKSKQSGFTLIELLAVIVIIAIILAIAIPGISIIIKSSRKSAFESDAKMVFQAIKYKKLEQEHFDPLTINNNNIKSLLSLDNTNYSSVSFSIDEDNQLNLVLVGKSKWDGLIACGTYKNVKVVESINECGVDQTPVYLTVLGSKNISVGLGMVYNDAGAKATNSKGRDITDRIVVSNPVDTSVEGAYTISYSITNQAGDVITDTRTVEVINLVRKLGYTGSVQTFEASRNGVYKIELWGAQGTGRGRGAYTSGMLQLFAGEKLYVYVGQGNLSSLGTTFNCGTGTLSGQAGGGATDIRLVSGAWNNFDSLKSRIMVAAGSGSGTGNNNTNLGYGGKLVGGAGGGTKGGTQTSAGARQTTSFTLSGFGYANGGCTGGNGYYGGGASSCANGGGGGSSFISGYGGCDAIDEISTETDIIHTGQPNHYSGIIFSDPLMIAGNEEMPTQDGTSTMIGNQGNGYAKITYIGSNMSPKINIIGGQAVNVFVGEVYSDAGATAFDSEDGDLTSKIIVTGNVNPNVLGTYTITYTVTDKDNNTTTITRSVKVILRTYTFDYTGNYQTFIPTKTGTYKVELWGASGATNSSYPNNGAGAYTGGNIHLEAGQTYYIYVGEKGNTARTWKFNGGAYGGLKTGSNSGGGATDIRLVPGAWDDYESLKSRIIVAAGGGGGGGTAEYSAAGQNGHGGALVGLNGTYSISHGNKSQYGFGGTQISGGKAGVNTYGATGTNYDGTFGKGGQSESTSTSTGSGGGGGGYYGGGAGGGVQTSGAGNGGGGGSSFISGHTGCDAIDEAGNHTGQSNHYSGKVFTDTVMIAGNASMPTYDGKPTMIGNIGNGYVKLTLLH